MDRPPRMFFVGLIVPFAVFAAVVLIVRPDSLLQWLAVAVTLPATSAIVAMVWAYRSRGPMPPPARARRGTARRP